MGAVVPGTAIFVALSALVPSSVLMPSAAALCLNCRLHCRRWRVVPIQETDHHDRRNALPGKLSGARAWRDAPLTTALYVIRDLALKNLGRRTIFSRIGTRIGAPLALVAQIGRAPELLSGRWRFESYRGPQKLKIIRFIEATESSAGIHRRRVSSDRRRRRCEWTRVPE